MSMTETRRIPLTDEERALARRLPEKAVWVGVVNFRGPRGRKYRPLRTKARATEETVREEIADIRSRQYRGGAFAYAPELLLVDQLGNVLAEEKI